MTTDEHEALLRRRSLLAIVLALLLLAACAPLWLLLRADRSTAAFSDAEVFDQNRLGAARLDIEVGEGSATFEAENLAPGDLVSGHLELRNAGTLPLLYEVSGSSDGDPLAAWIRLELWYSDGVCRTDDTADRFAEDLVLDSSNGATSDPGAQRTVVASGALDVGEDATICLGARLLLEAPNAVQGRRTEFDVVIDAVHDIELGQSRADG